MTSPLNLVAPYCEEAAADPDLVAKLAMLMDLAHSGGLNCVAFAATLRDGQVMTWNGGPEWEPFTLLGALRLLEGRILSTLDGMVASDTSVTQKEEQPGKPRQ